MLKLCCWHFRWLAYNSIKVINFFWQLKPWCAWLVGWFMTFIFTKKQSEAVCNFRLLLIYLFLIISMKYLWTLRSAVSSGWNAVASILFCLTPTILSSIVERIFTFLFASLIYGARIKTIGISPIESNFPIVSKLPSCLP